MVGKKTILITLLVLCLIGLVVIMSSSDVAEEENATENKTLVEEEVNVTLEDVSVNDTN